MTDSESLKARVKAHWEDEACGTRYGSGSDRRRYFTEISAARYALEPYIPRFARFSEALGKKVLEIGVGAGADFENWCRHAAHASGVDLTATAIALTGERLQLCSIPENRYALEMADAEHLPFDSNRFDIVYSWGVLHHTPDTIKAFSEAYRVLKPGGMLRGMVYHVPSWTGLLLSLRRTLSQRRLARSMKESIYYGLESPGTKAYTTTEFAQFLQDTGFAGVALSTKLGPGDLLTISPSKRYAMGIYRIGWRLYPRPIVRLIGDRFGLNLLFEATKPLGSPA